MTSAPYNPSQTASDGPAWSANPAENRKLKPDSLSGGREAVQHPNTATRRTAGDHVGLLPIADLPQRPRATSLPGVRIEVLNVGRRSTDAESSRTADQGGACGAAGPAPAPGSALGRPARRKPATPAGSQIKGGSFVTRSGTARSRLPHSGIVQLAATASMAAVRAVAGDRLRRTMDAAATQMGWAPVRIGRRPGDRPEAQHEGGRSRVGPGPPRLWVLAHGAPSGRRPGLSDGRAHACPQPGRRIFTLNSRAIRAVACSWPPIMASGRMLTQLRTTAVQRGHQCAKLTCGAV